MPLKFFPQEEHAIRLIHLWDRIANYHDVEHKNLRKIRLLELRNNRYIHPVSKVNYHSAKSDESILGELQVGIKFATMMLKEIRISFGPGGSYASLEHDTLQLPKNYCRLIILLWHTDIHRFGVGRYFAEIFAILQKNKKIMKYIANFINIWIVLCRSASPNQLQRLLAVLYIPFEDKDYVINSSPWLYL